MPRRNYSNTAVPQVLTAPVDGTATTLSVASTAGYPPVPFLLGLERGTANEEVALCTALTGTSFTVTRAYDGTTGKSHAAGALVEHTVSAIDYLQAPIDEFTTAQRDALTGSNIWPGRVIFNTTDVEFQGWDGTEWGPLGGGGAIVQNAEPPGEPEGALWWDDDDNPPSAFGNADTEVVFTKGVIQEDHQRSTTNTYTSGKLTQVVEKSGTTTVKTTTLTYTGDNLTQVVEVAGGKTVTITLAYTGSDLTGTTRTVS